MQTININSLPELYKESELCSILFETNHIAVVPIKYKPVLPNIKTYSDFVKIIDICRYWCVDKLPNTIYEYVLHQTKYDFILGNPILDLEFANDYLPINELKFLIKNFNNDLMNLSIKYGYINLVKYFYKINMTWDKKLSTIHAVHQNDEYVYKTHDVCLENECKPYQDTRHGQRTTDFIFKNDNFMCLKYLHDNGYIDEINKFRKEQDNNKHIKGGISSFRTYGLNEKHSDSFVYSALNHCSINCLKFLYNNGYKYFTGSTITSACSYECLQYMINKGYKLDNHIMVDYIRNNNMKCLKLCVENGCTFDEYNILRNNSTFFPGYKFKIIKGGYTSCHHYNECLRFMMQLKLNKEIINFQNKN
jgi:hypothetical protein